MNELSVTVKLLTPLFMAGARPRGEPPEMRVPSIRGALRYWYRTAAGANLSMKMLYDAESSIFGDTEQASSVIIKARWPKGEPQSELFDQNRFSTGKIDPLGKCQTSGKNYLLWSMRGFRNEHPRGYYIPSNKAQLEIKIKSRIGAKDSEKKLLDVAFSFWLLSHLGGIGARARRTAGSIQVIQAKLLDGFPSFKIPATAEELVVHLKEGIQAIRSHFGNPIITKSQQYDVLSSSTCKIWILRGANGTPWRNWMDAVETIGSYLCSFRNKRPSDYPDVLNWINGISTPATVQRAIFGLPLPFRYSNGTSGTVVGEINEGRRASPLHLRIYELSGGEYVGIATLFLSDFLPRDTSGNPEKLKIQNKSRTPVPAPSDYNLIEDFIKLISPTPLEVKL